MQWLVAVVATVVMVTAHAQTNPQLTAASAVLSAIRIALNLGNGRQEYHQVDVVAEGATLDQARQEGFRLAVNQAVGSVIATQTHVENQRVVRDEIVNYSSGFVDRFEILEQQGNRIRMRVWVAESRLAHRLLGQSHDSAQVPGGRIGAQIDSMIQERQQGDRLIEAVMRDYPHRSFDVEVGKSRVRFTDQRQAVISTSVTVRWNRAFVSAVNDTLRRTQDPVKQTWVYQTAVAANPVLELSAVDQHGTVLQRQCLQFTLSPESAGYVRPTRYLLTWTGRGPLFDTGYKIGGDLEMNFGQDTQTLRRVDQIRVKIVSQSHC